MRDNHGTCPADAKGKRIRGYLRNGMAFGFAPVSTGCPAGWPAETTHWSVDPPHPFDVARFEVIR